jgi:hypothetical protein
MRKLLVIALLSAGAATTAWAQAPQVQVIPAVPATVAPSTIQMLDAIRTIADTQVLGLEQNPTPVPAQPPARPARPAPAPPAAPGSQPPAPVPPPPATAKPPAAALPPVPPVPTRLIAPRNVRFEIAITDTGGPKPVTKVVSVTVADNGASGSIRSIGRLDGQIVPATPGIVTPGSFPLNLDVRGVTGYDDGSVRASVNVEYQPYVADAKTQPGAITASATAVFQDGRKVQILQSTDPLTDRRTMVDVTATILK